MHFLSLFIGLVPAAHANTTTLDTWGSSAPGIADMWTSISNSVYTSIPAGDIVEALTKNLVYTIFSLISGAAVLLIMYAGIRMIISRGKEDEFTQGKTIITWALIGLALSMLASVAITFFEQGFLPTFFQ